MNKQNAELPAELASALEQFTHWRAEHKPPTRFPDQLWSLAAELASRHGHHRVCRVLKLDYYSLKKRLEPGSANPKQSQAPAFVEFLPDKTSSTRSCTIECESARGDRIRIHLDGRDLSELRIFCSALWSGL